MFFNIKNPKWLCNKGKSLQVTLSTDDYIDVDYVINDGGYTNEEKIIWDNAINCVYGDICKIDGSDINTKINELYNQLIDTRYIITKLHDDSVLLGSDNSNELIEYRNKYKKLLTEFDILKDKLKNK